MAQIPQAFIRSFSDQLQFKMQYAATQLRDRPVHRMVLEATKSTRRANAQCTYCGTATKRSNGTNCRNCGAP